jgi:hypothetical protein
MNQFASKEKYKKRKPKRTAPGRNGAIYLRPDPTKRKIKKLFTLRTEIQARANNTDNDDYNKHQTYASSTKPPLIFTQPTSPRVQPNPATNTPTHSKP